MNGGDAQPDVIDQGARPQFATTRWTLVVAAGDRGSPQARAALAELCAAYWHPLYAFCRRVGYPPDQAQDLTQEYFARLLEKDYLGQADQSRGKFRSFLLTSFQHFLANEHDRSRARKRGGGLRHLSIDWRDAEARTRYEPSHGMTPERLFLRRWAMSLLDQALARLREEYTRAGLGPVFDALKAALAGDRAGVPYPEVAARLGLSVGAVAVAVHRLRQRYRKALRTEIARTVDDPADVDAEVRDLFAALAENQ
jgi:RNA polymerase sigma-70 factor (ECF subfamily)